MLYASVFSRRIGNTGLSVFLCVGHTGLPYPFHPFARLPSTVYCIRTVDKELRVMLTVVTFKMGAATLFILRLAFHAGLYSCIFHSRIFSRPLYNQ